MAKRAFIAPDFFSVAPELIGLPLASPSRRGMAMAIDGILVAFLVQAGGVFLGLSAVFVLWRASRSGAREGFLRNSVRLGLRVTAAIVMFVVILQAWQFGEERITHDDEPERSTAETSPEGNLKLNFGPGEGLAVAGAVAAFARADDPAEVRDNAYKILSAAKRAGATAGEIREARGELVEMLGDDADDANVGALDSVIAELAGPAPAQVNEQDSLRSVIRELNAQVGRLDSRNDSLNAQLERARERRGVRSYLGGLFDDLGLGFGWAAVYFTAFLAMMRGQTPGKLLLGVRVIRLDGKPLGWWIAFERFGGYAASFSVGLLGFFQILWDRNRQGLHDKACETVVVRTEVQPAVRS